MRMTPPYANESRVGRFSTLLVSLLVSASACTPTVASNPAPAVVPAYEETPIPTVPPATAAPAPTAAPTPLPTRPVGSKDVKPGVGGPIGPVITYFGAARADGLPVEPESVDAKGVPTFLSVAGSGFILVVEAKPGSGGFEVGRRTFVHGPEDPSLRPDLEIQVTRDLGDGSKAVCDRRRPELGGVPKINPPNFEGGQAVADALNDLSCRFEAFTESEFSCTLNSLGNYAFVKGDTANQFCVIVAKSFAFPEGITEVRVRLKDVEGNPGPVSTVRIRRPKAP
jgi:hypothetical protein